MRNTPRAPAEKWDIFRRPQTPQNRRWPGFLKRLGGCRECGLGHVIPLKPKPGLNGAPSLFLPGNFLADVFVPVFQVFLYFRHEPAGIGPINNTVIEAQGETDDT